MSEGSSNEFFEIESKEVEELNDPTNGSFKAQIGFKWKFRDAKWRNPNFLYNPMSRKFLRHPRMLSFVHCMVPSFITFFELFWTHAIIDVILVETNLYATAS